MTLGRDHWYLLPEHPTAIQVSGGLTSGYMLHEILRVNGGLPSHCRVIFQNTGREHEATLDFVAEMAYQWDVEIVWLEYTRETGVPTARVVDHATASRQGEPFDALLAAEQFLPSHSRRFCTRQLKILTARRWLRAQGWDWWYSATGFRADESERMLGSWDDDKIVRLFPMVYAGVTKAEVHTYWRKQNWGLKLPDVMDENPLGNCDGCFLKSESQRAHLAQEEPERFAWWQGWEERLGKQFARGSSYQELAEFVRGKNLTQLDQAGILCQKDGGDCTG